MVEGGKLTQRRIRYTGIISAGSGILVVIGWTVMVLDSESSATLLLQTVAVVLGGAALALDGISRIRNPSPPETERERNLELLKTMLILGLILAGVYGHVLF